MLFFKKMTTNISKAYFLGIVKGFKDESGDGRPLGCSGGIGGYGGGDGIQIHPLPPALPPLSYPPPPLGGYYSGGYGGPNYGYGGWLGCGGGYGGGYGVYSGEDGGYNQGYSGYNQGYSQSYSSYNQGSSYIQGYYSGYCQQQGYAQQVTLYPYSM